MRSLRRRSCLCKFYCVLLYLGKMSRACTFVHTLSLRIDTSIIFSIFTFSPAFIPTSTCSEVGGRSTNVSIQLNIAVCALPFPRRVIV